MKFAEKCNEIFDKATAAYHVTDRVDAPYTNPYPAGSIEAILFDKNWIDVNQWHMEDLIRDPPDQSRRGCGAQAPHRFVESGAHRHGGEYRLLVPRQISRREGA